MSRPLLSIVIVTWNSESEIGPCVESLRAHTRMPCEIIVVDNASTDGTRARIDALRAVEIEPHPDPKAAMGFRVIRNTDNAGYAPAANQGLRTARGEYLVLLNPDTRVCDGWDERLAAALEPGVGAVGPVSNCAVGLQFFGRYLEDAVDATAERLLAQGGFRGREPLETRLLMGFCLMIPRTVIEAHGLLDGGLDMGGDDLEYSWRLRRAGLELRVVPEVFVWHRGQASFAAHPADAVERYRQDGVDRVYDRLLAHYGADAVPAPMDLWGINWFQPTQKRAEVVEGLVSIVIPVVSELELTLACLEAIRRNTPERHEVIVVDNGSTDGTGPALAVLPSLRVVRNERNLGFAGGVNRGIRAASGSEIVLLNNDTLVAPGWLRELRGALSSGPRVGLVGATSNYVGGGQQIEVDYARPEESEAFGARWSERFAGRYQPMTMLTGLCLLVKREVFDVIGLFDERFLVGNFEDNDFCLRARLANYDLRLAVGSFVHHYGSRTFKAMGVDYMAVMKDNQRRFREKWNLPDPEDAVAAVWTAVGAKGGIVLDEEAPLSRRIEVAAELHDLAQAAGLPEVAAEFRTAFERLTAALPAESLEAA